MIVMYYLSPNGYVISPLYIHNARLFAPRKNQEAEKYNFATPNDFILMPDKLRFYRYQKGLLQADVAKYIGIDRGTYSGYEEPSRDYYPIENMEKIARLFGVKITDLLDDYNLFLYKGQGKQIKSLRNQHQITQAELAKRMGVQLAKVKRWEQDKVRMCKGTWEKLYSII